jgi:hypothetical protein
VQQPGEGQRGEPSGTAQLHVHLRDHEGVGDLVAAHDGDQPDLAQQDGGRADDPHRRVLDLDVLVDDPSALDDVALPALVERRTHVDEDGLLVEEGGQRIDVALRHPAPLVPGELDELLLLGAGRAAPSCAAHAPRAPAIRRHSPRIDAFTRGSFC